MNAVNLGPGEITDRLTILALKILHGLDAAKDVTHFVRERNVLLVALRGLTAERVAEQTFELAAVNAALWQAEDELREWRDAGWDSVGAAEAIDIAAVAFRIQALNDRRAELVREINKQAGSDVGAEKL